MVKDWETISFVIGSKYRQQVLEILNFPKTPTKIAKDLNINKAHVSRSLAEMMKRRLVRRLTPESRKGKLFSRTSKGKIILKDLPK